MSTQDSMVDASMLDASAGAALTNGHEAPERLTEQQVAARERAANNPGGGGIVLIDNHDSFVYNLVDALAHTAAAESQVSGSAGSSSGAASAEGATDAPLQYRVFRNSATPLEVLSLNPDLIVLSPGPGHPTQAGRMMELIEIALGRVPMLGICLGFQALIDHLGGTVAPCGPVHGSTDHMRLSDAGVDHPVFAGLTVDAGPERGAAEHRGRLVPVARYHSLGATKVPEGLVNLGTCPASDAEGGEVVMAAETDEKFLRTQVLGTPDKPWEGAVAHAMGLQFHPESVLSPSGPIILQRALRYLKEARV
ncbi:glutamine amidotransferase-related protein [Corynebacterium spheniscorum]|uniref:anthranilate synthase n=1 Tax=Corynebacterium spheniscorum TaxID=185761 RepID=A0A1I2UDC4_9CORY|nr:Anthranilate/para-aminobenzoate synthase component II [Corynebacterium spheniscorum]